MDKFKATVTTIMSGLMGWLGILAIPVLLLVGCNIMDYVTRLMAEACRGEVSSEKSIKGIIKKICQWLLVVVGWTVDVIIQYAVNVAGVTLNVPFIVATVVAVWLVVNELISILENIIDIGAKIPPFLLPVVKYIKKQTESAAQIKEDDHEQDTEV